MNTIDAKIIGEYERRVVEIKSALDLSEDARQRGDYEAAAEGITTIHRAILWCILDLQYLRLAAVAPNV